MMDVSELCYLLVEDVSKRTKQMDIQYLLGFKRFFSIYVELFLVLSQNYRLPYLLSKKMTKDQLAGCRRIHVQ